jgi:ferredoxin-NADP reductase
VIEDVRPEHGYHPLTVKAVVPETADTRSFVLDVPADLRDTFRYRPGQFCTFRAHVGGDELLRCYSMSSAPETDADLTVTVKRVPGGKVSNWFNDQVVEGDVLEVTKPAGVFCPRDGDHPVVALCGGSGVTPVLSIAKSVLATTDRPVDVLYANRDEDSVIFRAELDALLEQHPDRLSVRHHFDSDGGFLDAAAVATFAKPHLTSADFYLCGPGPFMDLVEATLLDWGVDADRILLERFVTPADDPSAVEVPPVGEDSAATDSPPAVTIILNGKRTEVPYRPGDTVLDTARSAGLQPPFSCEAGNCATCMAKQHEGTATLRANTALTDDEVAEGWILTCQALPHGPVVTVEYEAF